MRYTIRELKPFEFECLVDFLYNAIFVPEGCEPPPRSIVDTPALQVYVADFGKPEDYGLVAEVDSKRIGAIWARIMNDYGHIDDATPSLALSVNKAFRGKGVGTALLKSLLGLLDEKGYEKVSLSVQRNNPAHRLYARLGFEVVAERDTELLMCCQLKKRASKRRCEK